MGQSELEALLGRSLTSTEVANLALYLNIAKESLEGLLCSSLDGSDAEERTFEASGDYRTVFTGIFNSVSEVKLDNETVDTADYHAAQWDNRNATWYNSIVFEDAPCGVVTVTADWGFTEVPGDLKLLWAQLFANTSKLYKAGPEVQSKKVEDFQINYAVGVTSISDDARAIESNRRTISRYSLCTIGEIRNGKVWCGR